MPSFNSAVRPAAGPLPLHTSPALAQRFRWSEPLVGYVFIALSIASGVYYLSLLTPYLTNDMYWAAYNLSGHEAYLVDAANTALLTMRSGYWDLLAPRAMQRKSYIAPVSFTSIAPTYVRRLIYSELTSVPHAIANLRSMRPEWVFRMSTQFCYVDFNQTFEVAHTLARQARCRRLYASNGAVYYESILRNVRWDAFLSVWGGATGYFTVTLEATLQLSAAGRHWLTTTSTNTLSMTDEVAFWASYNLTSFELAWQNRWQASIAETINVRSALGTEHTVTPKHWPRENGPWSSWIYMWIPLDDVYVLQQVGASAIRGATNFYDPKYFAFESHAALASANGTYDGRAGVVHATLGPFLSFDTFYIPVPAPLLAFFNALDTHLAQQPPGVLSLATAGAFTPRPPAWRNQSRLYGGSLLCLHNTETSYVQAPFDFDDPCLVPTVFRVAYDAPMLVFAQLLYGVPLGSDAPGICRLQSSSACLSALNKSSASVIALSPLPQALVRTIPDVIAAVKALDLRLIQFTNPPEWTLLEQRLLDDTPWSVYGWLCIYDWVIGRREVVSFQGDIRTLQLISNRYIPRVMATSGDGQYLEATTQLALYLSAYVSIALASVGLLTFLYGATMQFDIVGRNLAYFNAVAGASWVGRPLLFARGSTAILVLSTSPMELLANSTTSSHLVLVPRPLFTRLVLCTEAAWVATMLNDICLLLVPVLASIYAPVASLLAFIATFALESAAPVAIAASLNRTCRSHDMDYAIECTSGTIAIGDASRMYHLYGVQVLSVLMALALAYAFHRQKYTSARRALSSCHVIASGAASAFLDPIPTLHLDTWRVDDASSVMCGLVPLWCRGQRYTFDLKLWTVLSSNETTEKAALDKRPNAGLPYLILSPMRVGLDRLSMLFGLLYMCFSIAGSISYLAVSKVTLANDMLWAGFNLSGSHAFLATWLNDQFLLQNTHTNLALDAPHVNWNGQFTRDPAFLPVSPVAGAMTQQRMRTSLVTIVHGIRGLDGCEAPWVFVPYCFLDLQRHWTMAISDARQARCDTMRTNGAVYLEPLLRNVPLTSWAMCWSEAFELTIGRTLRSSILGHSWLATTLEARSNLSAPHEAAYWVAHGIRLFETQWQNYKRIGLLNSYVITNAFGVAYPYTLQSINGTYGRNSATTLKMYWSFANDLLYAMGVNATSSNGTSLLRSSASFLYTNTSLETTLIQEGVLAWPLDNGLSLVRQRLGPFGTIDMHLVACPRSLLDTIRSISVSVRDALRRQQFVQDLYFNMTIVDAMHAVPQPWLDAKLMQFGASILCPAYPSMTNQPVHGGTLMAFTLDGSECPTDITSKLYPSADMLLAAAVLANLSVTTPHKTLVEICDHDRINGAACLQYLPQTVRVLDAIPPMVLPNLSRAIDDTWQLGVGMVTYARRPPSATLTLEHAHLLSEDDPSYAFFGWCSLFDWAIGHRQVVRFQGDNGTLTLLSEYIEPVAQATLSWQLPQSAARYASIGTTYVTYCLLVLAATTAGYILLSCGHVEGWNMATLNSVGGMVWVGRPLLLLRSMTAMGLLSTSALDLAFDGRISGFIALQNPWYTTCLAASEVTWFVAVVNDVAMALTQAYTISYATLNLAIVWLVAAVLSIQHPVQHSASLLPTCTIEQIDWQLVCESASIQIGRPTRLVTLVGTVFTCNCLCYLVTRLMRQVPLHDRPVALQRRLLP
ncbi:hypothetical protein SDRG_13484 [Saprolegnia diclina VS20]|uniref:Uncharacterized protein n=1 Tax=Saprolegnia diclina (strain VS20) TaxID=1156394 RepID=T0R9I3_SAPDV|nr:hypothetical protein SDRG_13484 [Saprolegnia diclina VS20]EQC28803.1 hypothetical protein SDRG_13484 [Saprolegnia diclina VS20]|eukprot:XP_008617798.1 hypothetical protein SDRG_13484 [Saprolegnia diclina VS20]